MNRYKYFLLLFLCITSLHKGYSQESDTAKIIRDIREKFALISNHDIRGMKECSYTPKAEVEYNDEEAVFGFDHEFTFYYTDSTIYMIREYSMSDEGGPLTYGATMSETYLFHNEPFFYYQKKVMGDSIVNMQPVYGLRETRKYIHKGNVIRELIKYTRMADYLLIGKSELLNVKTDSVPNTQTPIDKIPNNFYWYPEKINEYLRIIETEGNCR